MAEGVGLFEGKKDPGEPKLLGVINRLLTTTGCGPEVQRPQPMGVVDFPVNGFVVRKALIF